MIVCVCPNPAIDVTYYVKKTIVGETNRVRDHQRRPGGKAINTALVLTALGHSVTVVTPLGGQAGREVVAALSDGAGISLIATPLSGTTRSTVTVVDDDSATVFAERGPELNRAEWASLCSTLAAQHAEVVVMSGSLPPVPRGAGYADLIRAARPARVVLDTGGADLAAALGAAPDVVRPNLGEACSALNRDLSPEHAARALVAAGAGAAIVSNGPSGLVAAVGQRVIRASPVAVRVGNATGAGDAANAAVAAGLVRGTDFAEIVRDAVATSEAALNRSVAGEIDLAIRADLLALIKVIDEAL